MYLNAILVFLGLLLLAYLIYYFGFYRNWLYGCYGKINFESFKAFYAMNPAFWTLLNGYVEYTKYTNNGHYYDECISGSLGFNQIDAIKYQNWRRKLDKQKEQEEKAEKFQEILNALQASSERLVY